MKTKNIIFIAILLSLPFSYTAMAADQNTNEREEYIFENESEENSKEDDSAINGDYDYTKDEEYTQSFYRPKTTFRSDMEYKNYCKRMYDMGYMDSDYEWTSAAQDFINNSTGANLKKLDKDAQQIVEDRIESGEMSYEDSPYLTYDEKQKIANGESTYDEVLANRNITSEKGNSASENQNDDLTPTATEIPEDIETSVDDEISSPTITPEKETIEDAETDNSLSLVKIVIMSAIIVLITFVSYFIYKKQF